MWARPCITSPAPWKSPKHKVKPGPMSDVYVEVEDRSANKKPRRVYEAKDRKCLMCATRFTSEWAGDRICKTCKSSRAWRNG